MEEKILEIINKIISKRGKKLSELERDISLRNDLEMDSLDLAELTVRIEDEFGVDIFENRIVDKVHEVLEEIEKSIKI